jgi:ribonuclease HI
MQETYILDSIVVDASCVGNPGPVEYKGLHLKSRKVLFHFGPHPGGTNNIGEFLALVHAIAYCKKNNLAIPIYTDSQTAISWVNKKQANTTMQPTKENEYLLSLIIRANNWLQKNTYSNKILKWRTDLWGEIPADYGRKV